MQLDKGNALQVKDQVAGVEMITIAVIAVGDYQELGVGGNAFS